VRPRAARAVLGMAVAMGLVVAWGGVAGARVHVEPLVNFALPSSVGGCAGSTTLAGGAERVPITVSTVAGQVAESLNVCIGGKGPYPFVLDSGAGESTIDTHLARTLHLRDAGPGEELAGVGCTGAAQPVAVPEWSLDGVRLAAQTMTASTLPGIGGRGEPVGLLGSDVLSRFGAVRIDFTAQTLTFGGPEGPVPNQAGTVRGPVGAPPSAALTQGQSGTTVPINVTLTPGQVALNVRVRFGTGPFRSFVVDTGSSQSVVASASARAVKLSGSDLAQRQDTVCSVITVPLVHSGPWSIPGVTLHQQLIGSTNFGPVATNGTQGLLGSDQLKRFGWVIFDYAGGRLVLG
jgi:hypothetical protein